MDSSRSYYTLCLLYLLLAAPLMAQTPYNLDIFKLATQEKKNFSGNFSALQNTSPFIDLIYARAEWQLNPSIRYIQGKVTYYFKALHFQTDTLSFDLNNALQIDSISQDNVPITYTHTNNVLKISTRLLSPENIDSVSICYQGIPPNSGFGSFSQGQTPGGLPVMWTLSEPYGAADWWPTRLNLGEKLDSIDMIIHTPVGFLASGNGILATTYSGDNGIYHHWKHRHPIATYLIGTSIAPFIALTNLVQLRTALLPVVNYVYPENEQQWRDAAQYERQMLQFYDSLLIPYPFSDEKYGHAQFGWGGGMEHQTMSSMSDPGEGLMAHELAHQWFGNHVTCGSWSDIWLNEGFATYFTGVYYERFFPQDFKAWKQAQTSNILQQAGGSVFVYDTSQVGQIFDGRLSYAKGAMVLHMLRKQIGDNAFFGSLRHYLSTDGIAGASARTSDLIHILEEQSGQSLQNFFDDWIFGQGYPKITVSQQRFPDGIVSINCAQTASMPNNGPYQVRIPLYLKWPSGDTLIHIQLNDESSNTWLQLPISNTEIISITPDPESDLIALFELVEGDPIAPHPEFTVVPNPSTGELFIQFPHYTGLPNQVELFNLTGQSILTYPPVLNSDGLLQIMPFQKPSSGAYFLRFHYDSHKEVVRFMFISH